MTYSRHAILGLIVGRTIVAAGGFALIRTPHKALAPWEQAGQYTDPRMQALSYALLTPNPHNRQPWEAELSMQDTVILWPDKTRNPPETALFDFFPDGERSPVAIATFADGGNRDPLFAHVMNRRSYKEPLSNAVVPETAAKTLETIADVYLDAETVDQIREIAWQAWMNEVMRRPTMKESVDLFHMVKAEINTNPDGIDPGGPFLESLMLVGMLTREGPLNPTSEEIEIGADMYRETFENPPIFVALRTDGNTRSDQIDARRRWLRLNLTTTALGLALHPVSQAL